MTELTGSHAGSKRSQTAAVRAVAETVFAAAEAGDGGSGSVLGGSRDAAGAVDRSLETIVTAELASM
jgi:hypothetical protein